jgi:HSP20 family protein
MALPTRRSTSTSNPPERWDPFREFDDLQARMERLMESAFSGLDNGGGEIFLPLVDVEETEDAWIVEAELPGAKKKDVHVELRDSELVIHGEIKERERKGILRRRTRRTGRFEYRVTIPGSADPDKIDASLDDGVLTVRLPKPAADRPREIQVNSGASR